MRRDQGHGRRWFANRFTLSPIVLRVCVLPISQACLPNVQEGKRKGENGGAGRERSDCFELKQRDKFFNESISRDRTSGRNRTLRQIHACFLSGGY